MWVGLPALGTLCKKKEIRYGYKLETENITVWVGKSD